MTTTLDAAKKRPTLEQILKAAPQLCQASRLVDPAELEQLGIEPTLRAVTVNGEPITAEMRDDLLRRIDSGTLGYCELGVPLLAYEQWDYEKYSDKDNRNFVCFRSGEMRALGGTGKRKPFLRDHRQYDSLARGGTLADSRTEQPEEGHHQIFQRATLTEPWAIAMYLRGNMTTVSIGWIPTGPVLCSACNAPVFEKCYHWPGDRLSEVTDDNGDKRYVRSRNGKLVVRWVYTKAELIETSCVPVPGVASAEMDPLGLRAVLASQWPMFAAGAFSDEESRDAEQVAQHASGKSPPSLAAPTVKPQPESTQMADQLDQTQKLANARKAFFAALGMSEEHRAHAEALAKTDPDAAEAFCCESPTVRAAQVQAARDADPVVFRGELTGIVVRASEGANAKRYAELAEEGKADRKRNEDQLAAAAAREEEHQVATICSSRIPNLPGSAAVHANIVRSLRKAGDPALLEPSLQALTGASNFVKAAGSAPGANDGVDAGNGTAFEAFESALAAFAKAKGKSPAEATEEFLATKQGGDLYDAYDKARRSKGGGAR